MHRGCCGRVDQRRRSGTEELDVSRAPGFVSGVWVRLDGNKGRSIVVFESEEAANAAAGQLRAMARAGVTLDSVSVGEVVARA